MNSLLYNRLSSLLRYNTKKLTVSTLTYSKLSHFTNNFKFVQAKFSSMSLDNNSSNTGSIHTGLSNSEVYDIPISVINRPLQSKLDEDKVCRIQKAIQSETEINSVDPIDVLWIKGREGGDYYFCFGGCHRWAAHTRLNKPTIRAKLVKSTVDDLRVYLGGSTPDLK